MLYYWCDGIASKDFVTLRAALSRGCDYVFKRWFRTIKPWTSKCSRSSSLQLYPSTCNTWFILFVIVNIKFKFDMLLLMFSDHLFITTTRISKLYYALAFSGNLSLHTATHTDLISFPHSAYHYNSLSLLVFSLTDLNCCYTLLCFNCLFADFFFVFYWILWNMSFCISLIFSIFSYSFFTK